MAEQNNKEEEFDVFSTEDWEAAFDSADKTVAMLSAERIVEATPAAVIVESLEAEGGQNRKLTAKANRSGPDKNAGTEESIKTAGTRRILLKQSSLEAKKRRPCLLSITGQPSMTVALVEVTRVVPKTKPVYGVGKVPIKWTKDEAFRRLERLEEPGCSVTTQGEARKDIMTIVNKFATPSNRPVVVEKETLHDKKRGVMKHSFLFAQILAPEPHGQEAARAQLKQKPQAKPSRASNNPYVTPEAKRITQNNVEKQTGNGTPGLTPGTKDATPTLADADPQSVGTKREDLEVNLEEELDLEAEDPAAGREGAAPQSSEGPTMRANKEEHADTESEELAVAQEEATPSSGETGARATVETTLADDDPKSRRNLQADFPRLPQGTWRALEEGPAQRQTDVRSFFDAKRLLGTDEMATDKCTEQQTVAREQEERQILEGSLDVEDSE